MNFFNNFQARQGSHTIKTNMSTQTDKNGNVWCVLYYLQLQMRIKNYNYFIKQNR
jgi:hypothetical protein